MKRLLVLPSWYPNQNQNIGFFFKEQAQFLNNNGFDVKVLMLEELHTKHYWFHKLKRIVKGRKATLSQFFLHQDPEAYSFPVILQKSWSKEKKIRCIEKGYVKACALLFSKDWKPHIIHVQDVLRAGFGAKKIHEKWGIPYVIVEHAPFQFNSLPSIVKEKKLETILKAEKIAGTSEFQKRTMQNQGINRPIEVLWNLMDETRFALKASAKETRPFVITTITTPDPVKDVATFFKAVSLFLQQVKDHNNIEIVVVGNNARNKADANTNYYASFAENLNIKHVCKFYVYLPRQDIEYLLQRSSVFISSSNLETYGVAIREAMLCGTPVISTKSGGPEDTINKDTGVLVEVGDYTAIATALTKFYHQEIVFDYAYIREHVTAQSGRKAFLKRMKTFYALKHD